MPSLTRPAHAIGLAAMVLMAAARDGQAQVSAGAKLGMGVGTFSLTESPYEVSRRLEPLFGAFLAVPVRPWLLLQPEIYYTRKGAYTREGTFLSGIPTLITDRWYYDYVEVVPMVRLRNSSPGPLNLLIGPYFAWQAGGDDELPARCGGGTPRSTDLGWAVAVALEVSPIVSLETRFHGSGRDLWSDCDASLRPQRHLYGALLIGLSIQ